MTAVGGVTDSESRVTNARLEVRAAVTVCPRHRTKTSKPCPYLAASESTTLASVANASSGKKGAEWGE